MCLQAYPTERKKLLYNQEFLQIGCFRKQYGLIIAISHSAKKSKFSTRAAQGEKKVGGTEGEDRRILQMFIFKKKSFISFWNNTVLIEIDAMVWKADGKL